MKWLCLGLLLLAGCDNSGDPAYSHWSKSTGTGDRSRSIYQYTNSDIEQFDRRITQLECKVDKILKWDVPPYTRSKVVTQMRTWEEPEKKIEDTQYKLGTGVKSKVSGDVGMIIQTMKPKDETVKVRIKGTVAMIFDWYPIELEIIPAPKADNDK